MIVVNFFINVFTNYSNSYYINILVNQTSVNFFMILLLAKILYLQVHMSILMIHFNWKGY